MENEKEVQPAETKKPKDSFIDYLHDLVCILAVMLILFLLCFRVVVVSGSSMYDTLVDGDYLLLESNVFYREPQRGDIVVAAKDSFENGSPIVKRIIATEGQTVDIDFDAGIVYVDGVALEEDYAYEPTWLEEGVAFPQVVEEGHVFVMGDNRNHSKDSRSTEIGQIDQREILGRVIFLFMPGTSGGTESMDFSRIGVIGR